MDVTDVTDTTDVTNTTDTTEKIGSHQRMKLRQSAGVFFVIAILAIVLYLATSSVEGFTGSRCGVDLPSCKGDRVRCINGYCRSDVAPRMPAFSDLPLAA